MPSRLDAHRSPPLPKLLPRPGTAARTATTATPATAHAAGDALLPARPGGPSLDGHSATVHLSTDAHLTPAARGGRRLADAVLRCIGSYDRAFLLDTDGLRAHVTQVGTRFMAAVEAADQPGSVASQLRAKFPGATVSLVGTAALAKDEQVYYLVHTRDGAVRKFEARGGQPVEAPKASGEIFLAAELHPGRHIAVRVPEVRFLIDPTLAPDYGVGRTVDVVMDTPIVARHAGDQLVDQGDGVEKEILPGDAKGEDGSPLGVALSPKANERGVILKYNGDHTYDVEVTAPDGSKQVVKQSEDQLRADNQPAVFNLHGSTYYDVSIDVDQDPKLQAFLDQAKAIAAKDVPQDGTPEQRAAAEKQALVDLTILCNKTLSYPDEAPDTTDEASRKALALMNAHSDWSPMKLGDLIDAGRGVCRHQAILMQLACQEAGITSRPVTAAANDAQGNLRGYHAFLETTLDDGTQYLTDPTWFDAGPQNVGGYDFGPTGTSNGQQHVGTPLWDTLYTNVLRQELPTWTARGTGFDGSQVKFRESNDPVIDAQGHVTPPPPAPVPPAPAPLPRAPRVVLDDVGKVLTGSSLDAYAQQLGHYAPVQLKNTADAYAQQNNAPYAAFYYAATIHQYPGTPLATQCWSALATELLAWAPNDAQVVALAQEAKALGGG